MYNACYNATSAHEERFFSKSVKFLPTRENKRSTLADEAGHLKYCRAIFERQGLTAINTLSSHQVLTSVQVLSKY